MDNANALKAGWVTTVTKRLVTLIAVNLKVEVFVETVSATVLLTGLEHPVKSVVVQTTAISVEFAITAPSLVNVKTFGSEKIAVRARFVFGSIQGF